MVSPEKLAVNIEDRLVQEGGWSCERFCEYHKAKMLLLSLATPGNDFLSNRNTLFVRLISEL